MFSNYKKIIKEKDHIIEQKDKTLKCLDEQMRINQGNCLLSIPLTNNELLAFLQKRNEYIEWDNTYTTKEIYDILCNAKFYLCSAEVLNASFTHFTEHEVMQNRPLSYRQSRRSLAVLELIFEGNYNQALHELQDCIINYQTDIQTLISVNEYAIYSCLISVFIDKIKKDLIN